MIESWPREVAALSDNELLAILDPEMVEGLPNRTLRELAGMDMATVGIRLAAVFEVGRRANSARVPRGGTITSSLDVYRQFRPLLRDLKREEFHVALMDVKNKVLREARISEGSLSASLVHPREAFALAVKEPAHAVIFVHNHPSGDCTPSDEDAKLTKRLTAAGEVLGIRVLDHVVIGDEDYYSFADAGRI